MGTAQFTLNEKGEILFQPQANNPVPGEGVAMLVRGDEALKPKIRLLDKAKDLLGEEAEAMTKIEQWFDGYMQETLGLLIQLKDPNLSGASKEICDSLYDAMGVIPRADIEKHIKELDEQGRAQIRFKKVKLGPILVFQPLLNKPAAVKLRAMLWALWYQKELSVTIPADGIVSQPIGDDMPNPHLYQTIGFPIYGLRAVRIDMLDRVVVDLYEQSKDWKFQVRHKYCEWLGCTVEDLYSVLEAMGHKKIDEIPAVAEPSSTEAEKVEAEQAEADQEKNTAPGSKEPDEKAASEEVSNNPALPELAWFSLKKDRRNNDKSKKPRPQNKKDQKAKPSKGKPKGPKQPKSMSFQIKGEKEVADSPFAVLEKLKKDA